MLVAVVPMAAEAGVAEVLVMPVVAVMALVILCTCLRPCCDAEPSEDPPPSLHDKALAVGFLLSFPHCILSSLQNRSDTFLISNFFTYKKKDNSEHTQLIPCVKPSFRQALGQLVVYSQNEVRQPSWKSH